ncbi:type II secretion system protein GspL [Photobacterium sanctipauli]|uniref:type II secretion system protein GspL n=1 Tax=Photobacterium sanctipauli TaxID=1342794 RepID=UPI001FE96D0F|nr:type II secretion system protein GspL [Photobacterium sanctipauli]
MSEFLTIRLNSRADQPVQWLVWSPQQKEVIASGQLASIAQLDDIADYAAQRAVYVLVPTSDVLLTEVAIPAGSSRQLATVLPFLLEEELAQDVDDLHVHLLQKSGEVAQVAVVEHRKVEFWLSALLDSGFEVKKMLPDSLCLPLFDNGYSAAELEGQWLIRQGESQGVCAESQWLDAWLSAQKAPLRFSAEAAEEEEASEESEAESEDTDQADKSEQPLVIHHYTPAPAGVSGVWQAEAPELVMQLLAQGAATSKANLLSGVYKQQPVWRKYLKPWRKAAIAAGLVLSVLIAEHLISVQAMEKQALVYKAESERIFREVLPQFNRIPSQSYLKRQMNSELARLGGTSSNNGILPWLAELQPALAKVPQLSVQNLKYDQNRNELRFQAVASDFQHFEQLRTLLLEDFEIDQGQLNREGEQVTGAVVLRRKS